MQLPSTLEHTDDTDQASTIAPIEPDTTSANAGVSSVPVSHEDLVQPVSRLSIRSELSAQHILTPAQLAFFQACQNGNLEAVMSTFEIDPAFDVNFKNTTIVRMSSSLVKVCV